MFCDDKPAASTGASQATTTNRIVECGVSTTRVSGWVEHSSKRLAADVTDVEWLIHPLTLGGTDLITTASVPAFPSETKTLDTSASWFEFGPDRTPLLQFAG